MAADRTQRFLQTDIILDAFGKTCPNSPKKHICYFFAMPKEEVSDEVDFLHPDKHQSFLRVDFNTLGIKVMSLLIDMIKHSQSTQSNKFAISLQYL